MTSWLFIVKLPLPPHLTTILIFLNPLNFFWTTLIFFDPNVFCIILIHFHLKKTNICHILSHPSVNRAHPNVIFPRDIRTCQDLSIYPSRYDVARLVRPWIQHLKNLCLVFGSVDSFFYLKISLYHTSMVGHDDF